MTGPGATSSPASGTPELPHLALGPLGRPLLVVALVAAAVSVGVGLVVRLRSSPEPHGDPVTTAPSVPRAALWIDAVALLLVATVMTWAGRGFAPIVPGTDTWGHLAKMQLMARDWPHVAWNASWYSGSPFFAGSYPPGYHATVMVMSQILGVTVVTAMRIVLVAAMASLAIGAAFTAVAATGRRWAGWIAGLFALGSGSVWAYPLTGSVPRLCALAATMVSLAATVAMIRRPTRIRWAVATIGLAVAAACHLAMAGIGFLIVGSVLCVGRPDELWRPRIRRGLSIGAVALAMNAFFYVPVVTLSGVGEQLSADGSPAAWRVLFGNSVVDPGVTRGFAPGLVLLALAAVLLIVAQAIVGRLQLDAAVLTNSAGRLLGSAAPSLRLATHGPATTRTSASSPAVPIATGRSASSGPVVALTPVPLRRAVSRAGAVPPPPSDLPRYVSERPEIPNGQAPDRTVHDLRKRVMIGLAVSVACCAFYAFGGHFIHFRWYLLGMSAADVLVVPAVIVPAILAIAAVVVSSRWPDHLRRALVTCLVAVGAVGLAVVTPRLDDGALPNSVGDLSALSANLPPEARGSLTHRVTATDDSVTRPLNAVDPVAQTRGFQADAVSQPDYQYIIETATSDPDPRYRRAIFDWWSVGWVEALPTEVALYSSESGDYRAVEPSVPSDVSVYAVRDPLPTMWSSAVPRVMVVSGQDRYQRLFRTLTRQAIGPDQAMLLRGPSRLDRLDPAALAGLDTLVVDASIGHPSDALWAALNDWVHAGGHLFIEGMGIPSAEVIAQENYPEPFPVTMVAQSAASVKWAFDQQQIEGMATVSFGEPNWDDTKTWELRSPGVPKPWAKTLLSHAGIPLVLDGKLGAGTVTWSGMNLAYHADVFGSAEEARLLLDLIGVPTAPVGVGGDGGLLDNEHGRLVTRPGDAGVYIAQNDSRDWRVTVDGAHERAIEAGPHFMWVPVPLDGASHTVELHYTVSVAERLANWISLAAIGAVLAVALAPWTWQPRRWPDKARSVRSRLAPLDVVSEAQPEL